MTHSVYHIKAHLARLILDGVDFIEIFVQSAAFDEPLGAHPKHELPVLAVRQRAKFVDANAGISRSFFQRQIALFPDWNLCRDLVPPSC